MQGTLVVKDSDCALVRDEVNSPRHAKTMALLTDFHYASVCNFNSMALGNHHFLPGVGPSIHDWQLLIFSSTP